MNLNSANNLLWLNLYNCVIAFCLLIEHLHGRSKSNLFMRKQGMYLHWATAVSLRLKADWVTLPTAPEGQRLRQTPMMGTEDTVFRASAFKYKEPKVENHKFLWLVAHYENRPDLTHRKTEKSFAIKMWRLIRTAVSTCLSYFIQITLKMTILCLITFTWVSQSANKTILLFCNCCYKFLPELGFEIMACQKMLYSLNWYNENYLKMDAHTV